MKKSMKLASRGKRFAAGMIDMSVPFLAYIILTSFFGMDILGSNNPYGYGNPFGYGYGYGYNYNFPRSNGTVALAFVLMVILIAYIIAEFVLFAKGQSIGKAILGLQVVSSNDGKPFRFWKMMLRECVVKSASGYVFLLGYIWILIDERNRGWHDKILDSYVVDLKETASMYKRAASASAPAAVKPETPKPETPKKEDSVDKQLEAAGLKPEAIEAPEKIEALEAPKEMPEVTEAVTDAAEEVPETTEEITTAAGDEQTEDQIKEDDTGSI